jgi:hypothetical protein
MPAREKIKQYINMLAIVEAASTVGRLNNAWDKAQGIRESGGGGDREMAIAEHYFYARYSVAKDGIMEHAKMMALISGYNLIKAAGGKNLLPKTCVCDVTDFSMEDVYWSTLGANEGLEDYFKGSKTANKIEVQDSAPSKPVLP